MFLCKYTYGCKGGIKAQENRIYSQNEKKALSFTKKDVQYMNIRKNKLVYRQLLKTVVLFFNITSGQILCWVLVMLLFDGYHSYVLHF